MTRYRILPTFIIFLLVTNLSLGAGFKLDVDRSVLDNGLTLLIYQDSTATTASVQTFVNAGSRDEDRPGVTGLAHVFEHMMFRGTEKYPSYSDVTAPLGAETNAYTTPDYTCYFINAEARFIDKMLDVESDRIRNLIFTNETFRTELGPIKEERRRGVDDDPGGFLEVELGRLAYVLHTYQHPVIGWEEDLEKNITFEDGKQFKDRFYAPNNCILVVVGNVDIKKTKALVEKYYADWKRGETYTPNIIPEPPQGIEHSKTFAWKDDETPPLMYIAFHSPRARDNPESIAALNMINEVLFSRSGRLTRLLKNDLSLVESIGGDAGRQKDPGLETITLRMKRKASLEAVRDTIYNHLELMKNQQITAEELQKAANNLRAKMIYQLDRPSRIAGSLGYFYIMDGDYSAMVRLYDSYATLTPDNLQAVAKETFDKLNRTVVTLVPKSGI